MEFYGYKFFRNTKVCSGVPVFELSESIGNFIDAFPQRKERLRFLDYLDHHWGEKCEARKQLYAQNGQLGAKLDILMERAHLEIVLDNRDETDDLDQPAFEP
jgi:hypothetical protein